MSIPPLKVRILNDQCIDLCKFIAKKMGVAEEDSDLIFHLEKEESKHPIVTSYTLSVEEKRPIQIEEEGRIVEILGDNQVGKTTTLLYMANLLGYDFYNEDNIDFLADEKLVKQGQEIFSKLVSGMKAKLEINAGPYEFTVYTEDGWIKLDVMRDDKKILFRPFDLGAMSDAFRDSISPFIRIQFVSKGRNFDWQLLMDISSEMKFYIQKVQARTDHLIVSLRNMMEESVKETAAEGIDYNARKLQIDEELESLKNQLEDNNTAALQLKLKLETLIKVSNQLPDLEKTHAFEVLHRIYQVETSLVRSRERLENLKRLKEKAKALETDIQSQKARLLVIEKELAEKCQTRDLVEGKFNQTVSAIELDTTRFLDEPQAFTVAKLLRDREIDLLIAQRQQAELEAIKVIEDLFGRIQSYNAAIRLPEELGGSVAALQKTFGGAKKIIVDQNLVKTVTDPLFVALSQNQLASTEAYHSLLDAIETLGNESRMLKEGISKTEKLKSEIDNTQDEKMLNKTETEIKKSQEELRDLQVKIKRLKTDDVDKLARLEKDVTIIDSSDPKALIHSADWADKILGLREQLENELREKEGKVEEIERKGGKLREEAKKIAEILSSPELEMYSRRMDCLNEFKGIMDTLGEILSQWRCLIDREYAKDQFISLDRHGITSRLDKAINEIFLERCCEYFRLVEKNKFETETITEFDYRKRCFTCDDQTQSIISLSGGTASIMTVLSLASKKTDALLGTTLLVDEFHDVAETLRTETYKRLIGSQDLSFSLFAKPLDKSPLITRTIDMEG